jgi:adenylate cyclase class IV
VPILVYEKVRESWLLDDCRVELDQPPGIGLFVEIEGPSESSIQEVRAKIGLSDTAPVRESYVRLLMDFCDKNSISPRVLRMESSAKR